jgi:penicillin amidase
MGKHSRTEVGHRTDVTYNNETAIYKKQDKYYTTRKLEVYHSSLGIHGLFCFFRNFVDEKLKNVKFYKEFQDIHLKNIENAKLPNFKKDEVLFSEKEFILDVIVQYDEESKIITAVKLKTNMRNISFGNKPNLNKKPIETILRDQYFITGFHTCYFIDKGTPFLSFISGFFEDYDNVNFYVEQKEPHKLLLLASRFWKEFVIKSSEYAKILIKIFLVIFPILYIYHSSQTIQSGEYLTKNVSAPIKIYSDSHGFTHIKANNLDDGYFGLGFSHAKDRLWQMETIRRLCKGKLSEVYGSKTLKIDKFMRQIGINLIASRDLSYYESNIYSHNYKHFNRYVEGINFYVDNNYLPFEFLLFWKNFEAWTLQDSLCYGRLMGFVMGHDFHLELLYRLLDENMGKEFADYVFKYRETGFPFSGESILSDQDLKDLNLLKRGVRINSPKPDPVHNVKQEQASQENKEIVINQTKEENGNVPNEVLMDMASAGASNNWVISGKLTESGFPILANDPHLNNGIPSAHYLVKIYLPENTITGSTFPGMPTFIIGSNKYLAWGVSSENSDVTDICEEKIQDKFYSYNENKLIIKQIKEEIYVRGSGTHEMIVEWTQNGPIIDTLLAEFNLLNLDYKHFLPISYRHAAYSFNNTGIEFFLKLVNFKTTQEILDNSHLFITPTLNFVWATKSGDIGYVPLGKYPLKRNKKPGFCRGYSPEDDIILYLKKEETPYLHNPRKGYIIAANNKFSSTNYKFNIQGFHTFTRAHRIRKMIQRRIRNYKKFNVEDNRIMMGDVMDAQAKYILPKLLHIYERNKRFNNPYYKELKSWDCVMNKNSTTATIYSVLELNLAFQLLTQKMSENVAKGSANINNYWNFIVGIIEKIYKNEKVELQQCAYLTLNKDCEVYLINILDNLDSYLYNYKDYHGKIKSWGEIHFNNYPSIPFDNIPLLSRVFSRRIPTDGNRNTVKISRGKFNDLHSAFGSNNSPNLKYINDLSDITCPYVIIDTGNSGNYFSKFYDNLIEKSENMELVKFYDHSFDDSFYNSTIIIKNIARSALDDRNF